MTDYIKREDAIKWATDFIEGVEEEDDICIVDPGGWESVHDYCEEAITCMIPSADVVEADKAQKEIDYWHDKAQSYEQTILKLALNKADVVEVIRCKDCKHNYRRTTFNHGKRDNPSCKYTNYVRDNDFYCGFGERAEA